MNRADNVVALDAKRPSVKLFKRRMVAEEVELSIRATVLDEAMVRTLARANALIRRLRGWGITVERVAMPSHTSAVPMLWLRAVKDRSISPLLDAVRGKNTYIEQFGNRPTYMAAALDECMVMYPLPPPVLLGSFRRAGHE